jgi:hypothetical protein
MGIITFSCPSALNIPSRIARIFPRSPCRTAAQSCSPDARVVGQIRLADDIRIPLGEILSIGVISSTASSYPAPSVCFPLLLFAFPTNGPPQRQPVFFVPNFPHVSLTPQIPNQADNISDRFDALDGLVEI